MHHNPILIENLTYTYPDGTTALREISISIKANERVALIGANGSGKSTLQLHLNGIILAQAGRVKIGGWPVCSENLAEIRNFVGLVFQNPDNQLFMPTVWEDVAFGPMNQGLRGEELTKRVLAAMAAVSIDPQRYGERNTENLSGGEKKRIAIAGVLAMNPQVLVLDEPSAQLDPRSRRELINLLRSLPLTQLIATHDLDMALELCDRTVVLSQGQVVFDGKTEQVMSDGDFLLQHALESPLGYSRPYCLLADAPGYATPIPRAAIPHQH
ncbi:energy-coupling factor ABC transporter ATP-binding protein [Microseira wollei]|uniref:Cobalt ABC transporter ATP-binding protein n=1 Tax=Microseira wollei NIES-4236 TaxID=2530354 RepID=A0AAV3XI37_9CYAN|nr:ATP-binding cassette domain-containing protein [Microseira wollei]GET40102.1 cobalt ABC transporter ATP-binding protein [Microseira wollei NIES-4236]